MLGLFPGKKNAASKIFKKVRARFPEGVSFVRSEVKDVFERYQVDDTLPHLFVLRNFDDAGLPKRGKKVMVKFDGEWDFAAVEVCCFHFWDPISSRDYSGFHYA